MRFDNEFFIKLGKTLTLLFILMQVYHFLGNPVDRYFLSIGLPNGLFNKFLHFVIFFITFKTLNSFLPTGLLLRFNIVFGMSLLLGVMDESFDLVKGYAPSIFDVMTDIFGAVCGGVVYARVRDEVGRICARWE